MVGAIQNWDYNLWDPYCRDYGGVQKTRNIKPQQIYHEAKKQIQNSFLDKLSSLKLSGIVFLPHLSLAKSIYHSIYITV